MTDPRSFGAWLRRERERRSISLRSIADRTKIGAGHLESLERGDVSRWPGGIYRRAFIRAYADAVGLDPELVVANFERVFPSDPPLVSDTAAPAPPPAATDSQEMRLALASPPLAGATEPVKTAARDLACVLGAAVVGFALGGSVGFWCVAAVVALGFHLNQVLGVSLRTLWRARSERRSEVPAEGRAEVLSFSDEQIRSSARRVHARHALADISPAPKRRAARS